MTAHLFLWQALMCIKAVLSTPHVVRSLGNLRCDTSLASIRNLIARFVRETCLWLTSAFQAYELKLRSKRDNPRVG